MLSFLFTKWLLTIEQLKLEYKIVKELRELSGFGWDKGKQMMMVLGEVWTKYLKASYLFILCFPFLTINQWLHLQSHPKVRPFKKKAFCLYDEIAVLCDDAIAMGGGAFRATWSDMDAEGEELDEAEMDEMDNTFGDYYKEPAVCASL